MLPARGETLHPVLTILSIAVSLYKFARPKFLHETGSDHAAAL